MTRITVELPSSGAARPLIERQQSELVYRYTGREGIVPPGAVPPDDDFCAPVGAFLVAWHDGRAVACGGLCAWEPGQTAEIKRVFVDPTARRLGLGRTVVEAIESKAVELGYSNIVLETGLAQPEAMALYEAMGYAPIDNYGEHADHPQVRSYGKLLP